MAMAAGLMTPSLEMNTVQAKQNRTEQSEVKRQVEALDRGATAIMVQNGVYLSWRYLGTDDVNTSFHIYRDGVKITDAPITVSTNYLDASGTTESSYTIHTLQNGVESEKSGPVSVWKDHYLDIPLDKPESGVTPTGDTYDYMPNDASCADLDGDGEYEIILKWMPSNSGDNMGKSIS